jgi:pyruvate dehydrogenase E2 component (dihydrolipoamide acetyltransferase)
MATDVIMPALGMAQETGKLVRWLKAEGEAVAKGEPLMEVETDKVTVEVEAPADGTLAALSAGEGEDVPVGQPVAVILAAGEDAPPAENRRLAPGSDAGGGPEPGESPADGQSAAESTVPVATRRLAPGSDAGDGDGPGPAAREDRPRRPLASPKARRLAQESGIDLATIQGSGPHGAVVAADVEQPAAEREEAAAPGLEVGTIWRRMAERTTQSWQSVPHFFLEREVDAGRLESWRASMRGRKGYEQVTHTDLLVKIAAAALREHPRVNASWADGSIEAHERVNVGIAVAVEDGLVVPVVHDADRLELREVVARRTELVAAAREGRLRLEDVSEGTFTISNLGMFGVDAFTAIVNAPQAAILAVGRIAERVVPVDGSPGIRPMAALTISFDHRVVDGARGAQFLDTLATLIEEPAGLVA